MRAVGYQTAGAATDVLELIEMPDVYPAPGEVRVAVQYSAVNPTDVKRRFAESPTVNGFQVPHHDGSGIIDEVGDGVPRSRIGERVWMFHAAHNRSHGTAAESICLPEGQAVALPRGMTLLEGSQIGIPMMTAAHALRLADVQEGDAVLVTGGGGAVGSAAITLARLRGATVIATVSSDEKAEIARRSGAHQVLNYRRNELATALGRLNVKVNAVVDVAMGTNLSSYYSQLANGATIVSYSSDNPEVTVPIRPFMFANAAIVFFVIYSLPDQEIWDARDDVTRAILDGARPCLPSKMFTLQECTAAHEHVEARLLGRAVVRLTSAT